VVSGAPAFQLPSELSPPFGGTQQAWGTPFVKAKHLRESEAKVVTSESLRAAELSSVEVDAHMRRDLTVWFCQERFFQGFSLGLARMRGDLIAGGFFSTWSQHAFVLAFFSP